MRKEHQNVEKEDLFESGKAYRNAFFGSGGPPYSGPPQGGGYPGVGPESGVGGGYGGGYGGGHGGGPDGNLPVPYGGGGQSQSPSSLLGNLPIKDIKSFIDRMGGIEGIMNTMTKMNSLMKNVQQMAPMLKLLAGSFFNKKSSTSDKEKDMDYSYRRKRRRRKRTSSRRKAGRNRSAGKNSYKKVRKRK